VRWEDVKDDPLLGPLHPANPANRTAAGRESRRRTAELIASASPAGPAVVPQAGPVYRLEIPGYLPPRLNALTRGRLRTRMGLERECGDRVADAFARSGIPPAECRRRVGLVLTFGPGDREGDVDAYFKGVLDALKKAGAIRDDSRKWCALAGEPEYIRGGVRHTTVALEDCP
jgi:hypothetical protein